MPALSLAAPPAAQAGVPRFRAEPPLAVRDLLLLVEDDLPVATLLMHVLARSGRRVLHARDGADCLRLFDKNAAAIRLVFMDCSLPDIHGGTLCQRLRATLPGLPILLTSGRGQPGLVALLAADGPTAFLPKPFLPADLLRQVEAVLAIAAG